MRPLHAVLLTLANSSYRSPLLSRQQLAPLTPLAATLMHFPASVANKRLTAWLSPLAATLTKNRGGVMVNQHPPDLDVWTFRRSDVAAFQLHSLSVQRVFHNSFAFTRIHTLSENCRGVPLQFPFWNPTPRLSKRMRTRPLASGRQEPPKQAWSTTTAEQITRTRRRPASCPAPPSAPTTRPSASTIFGSRYSAFSLAWPCRC